MPGLEIDGELSMNEKRGGIKVLAIVSWIWIVVYTFMVIRLLIGGPASPEVVKEMQAEFMEQLTPEVIEYFGEEYVIESLNQMEVANQKFYTIYSVALGINILGFFAVLLMYQLKRKGYYLYLLYSVLPVIMPFVYFGSTVNATVEASVWAFLALLFSILYGLQLKRME